MMLLTPLTRLLLGMRDVGLFVGPPLGAFLLVLVTWHTSKNKWLRRILIFAFSVAAIGEVWAIVTGGGLIGRVWRKLGGRYTGIKRIIMYVVIIFLLVIAKRRPSYDRQEYEATVRSAIEQWLDCSLILLTFLSATKGNQIQMRSTAESALYKLGAKIQLLANVSKKDDLLLAAVTELVQETENVGFKIIKANSETLKVIDWHKDLEAEYETFGNIEPGDRVIIEREPTIFEGVVREKGLVRKLRDRR